LRHAGASALDNAKVHIGAIQRILGHEKRETTEIYLHSIGESEREAMRIYEIHTQIHTQTENGASQELEKMANPV
ncbi:MAG: tyrosine-type recombinase/integrase, partial [Syntrophaceae bacterium]